MSIRSDNADERLTSKGEFRAQIFSYFSSLRQDNADICVVI